MTYRLDIAGDISSGLVTSTGSGATARSLSTRAIDMIFAADYGVKADGATDDTTAWGNAFTAASATGAKSVIAPNGVSVISTITIPAGVTLIGAAPVNSYFGGTVSTGSGSVLKKASGTNAAILTSYTSAASDNHGGGMRDIMVIGDGTHHGVTLANGIPYYFHRCAFNNCSAAIEGDTTNVGAGFATIIVDSCQFSYNSAGIWNVGDSRIMNSFFNGNGIGIQFDAGASANSIVNCKIEFNSGNGVQVDTCMDVVINGCNFDSNGSATGPTHNISWTNNSGGAITGNVWINQSANNTMTGNHLFLSGNKDTAVLGNASTVNGAGATPTNSIGGGANTSVILVGNALRGHSGATAINASVTGLTTTGNLT